MKIMHVAFCLEQAYGHIVPTLGIGMELLRRGHRVSYAVTHSFARLTDRVGARAMVIDPLEIRSALIPAIAAKTDLWIGYDREQPGLVQFYEDLTRQRTARSLEQLKSLYASDRPDVIIHDDCYDTAGRELAMSWEIAKIRHHSQFLDSQSQYYKPDEFNGDEIILMTVPEFFQPERQSLDARFRFVGFIPEGRTIAFEKWAPPNGTSKPILISATTGMLPQKPFYELMIATYRNRPWNVVLSISGHHDLVSSMSTQDLSALPANFRLNTASSNFDVVENSCLFVGQGGQGAALEAIFFGVPQIVIPASDYHDSVGYRVRDLGLGYCIAPPQAFSASIVEQTEKLLTDHDTLERVQSAGDLMRRARGAGVAADIIERYVTGRISGH
jgi:UDP:flavonoid glycosyltransferase YjiC (YdhE family)